MRRRQRTRRYAGRGADVTFLPPLAASGCLRSMPPKDGSLDAILRSGLAGGIAGCVVRNYNSVLFSSSSPELLRRCPRRRRSSRLSTALRSSFRPPTQTSARTREHGRACFVPDATFMATPVYAASSRDTRPPLHASFPMRPSSSWRTIVYTMCVHTLPGLEAEVLSFS
jgi:hypothetical protein